MCSRFVSGGKVFRCPVGQAYWRAHRSYVKRMERNGREWSYNGSLAYHAYVRHLHVSGVTDARTPDEFLRGAKQ